MMGDEIHDTWDCEIHRAGIQAMRRRAAELRAELCASRGLTPSQACHVGCPTCGVIDASPARCEQCTGVHTAAPTLQGGMSNDELREAWERKVPGIHPDDKQLTAFALGVEVGARHYFIERNSARDAWRRAADARDALREEVKALRAANDTFASNSILPSNKVIVDATGAAHDVLAERRRQIEREGYAPEHDDTHEFGDMAFAAACYATAGEGDAPPAVWPWGVDHWKPRDARRNMVRAAALLLAEIERLDRAAGWCGMCTGSHTASDHFPGSGEMVQCGSSLIRVCRCGPDGCADSSCPGRAAVQHLPADDTEGGAA